MAGRPAPSGPRPDGRAEEGSTLVELVVALTVLAIVLTFASASLAGSVRAELSTRRADTAQRLAHEAAERATVFDCGVLPAVATATVLDRQAGRCLGSLGTRSWSVTDTGTRYDLRFEVAWVEVRPNPAVAARCDRLRLQRSITATWTEDGRPRTRTVQLLASLPVDSVAQLRPGQLDVTGAPGGVVALTLTGGRRYPISLDAAGRGRIPFLDTGSSYALVNVTTGAAVTSPVVPATAGACSIVPVTVP